MYVSFIAGSTREGMFDSDTVNRSSQRESLQLGFEGCVDFLQAEVKEETS